ncbi:hypothetical protein D3C86_1272620 [compost metagenome]
MICAVSSYEVNVFERDCSAWAPPLDSSQQPGCAGCCAIRRSRHVVPLHAWVVLPGDGRPGLAGRRRANPGCTAGGALAAHPTDVAAQLGYRRRPHRALSARDREMGWHPHVGPGRRGGGPARWHADLRRGAFLGDRRYRQALGAGPALPDPDRKRGSPHPPRCGRHGAAGGHRAAAGQGADGAVGPVAGQLRGVPATGSRGARAGEERCAADPVRHHADLAGACRWRARVARRRWHLAGTGDQQPRPAVARSRRGALAQRRRLLVQVRIGGRCVGRGAVATGGTPRRGQQDPGKQGRAEA